VTDDARPVGTLTEELARLDGILPEHDPELVGTLNPPVREENLEMLRELIRPHELPAELETLLRWHDGQSRSRSWPLIEAGPLLSAAQIAEHHRHMGSMCEPFQWSDSWLPVAHEGWYTTVVECALPLAAMVIDASFPEPPSPKAFSLAVVMGRVCDLLEAGVEFTIPSSGTAEDGREIEKARWRLRKDVLQLSYPHFIQ
jgi:hypothetical protein